MLSHSLLQDLFVSAGAVTHWIQLYSLYHGTQNIRGPQGVSHCPWKRHSSESSCSPVRGLSWTLAVRLLMSYFNAAKGCYLRDPAHFYLGLLRIFEFQENWYLYKIREEKIKPNTL